MASNMFVRILTRTQVNQLVDMLNDAAGRKRFKPLKAGQDCMEIKAPDGEVVLAALIGSSGDYMCRLHKEVFVQ